MDGFQLLTVIFMTDLEAYLIELSRVQKNVNLYDELYCNEDAKAALENASRNVFNVLGRALNTEILVSVAALFDGEGYRVRGNEYSYLSQRYLVKKYEHQIDAELLEYRKTTSRIWQSLNIKAYRDFLIAHNDLAHYIGKQTTSHSVSTDLLLDLLNASYSLMHGILNKKLASEGGYQKHYLGQYGYEDSGGYLIEKLKNIIG